MGTALFVLYTLHTNMTRALTSHQFHTTLHSMTCPHRLLASPQPASSDCPDYSFVAGPTEVISLYSRLSHRQHTCSKIYETQRNSPRQELSIVLAGNLTRKVLCGKLVLIALRAIGRELVGLLMQQLECIGLVDLLALGRLHAMFAPLPKLGAGDFGSCGVLL
jgi:hypothetical protein